MAWFLLHIGAIRLKDELFLISKTFNCWSLLYINVFLSENNNSQQTTKLEFDMLF